MKAYIPLFDTLVKLARSSRLKRMQFCCCTCERDLPDGVRVISEYTTEELQLELNKRSNLEANTKI